MELKVYFTTLKNVIENLSQIKECPIEEFKDTVEENFDGYNYDGVEDIVGFDNWPDISKNGLYEVNVRIDHEDAYELSLKIENKDGNVSVLNVL
jgi:hypothetical protein